MKIKKVLETEESTYNIDCEFNEEEINSIIEIGLNVLLAHGALPFQETDEEDVYDVVPPSELLN